MVGASAVAASARPLVGARAVAASARPLVGASAVAASADAVVVGSALIAEMEQKAHSAEDLEEIQIHGAAVQLLQSIRAGVDSSPS